MRLSRNDRWAILVIAALLLALNAGLYFFRSSTNTAAPAAVDTLSQNPNLNSQTYTPQSQSSHPKYPVAKPFPFDPNTADSATFVRLGLRPNVARAIVHYRKAGGTFRKPQDLARIYTLNDSDYRRLLPYVQIKQKKPTHPSTPKGKDAVREQYPSYQSNKLNSGEKLDINIADTTELKRIPGVGTYYAGKIVKYRDRLGGFVSPDQLREIKGLPDDIARWVTIGQEPVSRLHINELTFGQLLRHPYLNFEQVSAIMDHRKHTGPIRSLADLRTYPAFSDADFRRLQPYLAFE
ncbi:MAG: helix-hairpin-helix domain-containing protein [Bacteroidaceae bacterium]|nr:helix-hairpin-helix domain-containing protein [Bacteroidaceae bacterium]